MKIVFIIWRELHAFLFYKPVEFSIRAGLLMFLLLTIMPAHPMAPLVASGGGLSLGLILWRVR